MKGAFNGTCVANKAYIRTVHNLKYLLNKSVNTSDFFVRLIILI